MTSKVQTAAELASVLTSEWHTEFNRMTLRAWIRKYGVDVSPPSPSKIAADALALLRIGAGIKRWAERARNGEGHRVNIPRNGYASWSWDWGDADDAAKDKADARALAKASEIATRYGATVSVGGNPCGFVVHLHLASGRHNSMGGATASWAVA